MKFDILHKMLFLLLLLIVAPAIFFFGTGETTHQMAFFSNLFQLHISSTCLSSLTDI